MLQLLDPHLAVNMDLIRTIIGFGMSAIFIVFVCTRIIFGRIRGAESRQMFEIESRIDLEQSIGLLALNPFWLLQSSSNLPISTRTVQALTKVEAFALVAEDLKFVAQWRAWAACFVQAAWRRYYKRKQAAKLCEAEEKLQDALANEGETTPSLGDGCRNRQN